MPKKILIIDDESDILSMMGDTFQMEGYDVLTASDVATGMSKTLESKPDIVLIDVMLPDGDGFAVCKRIKSDRSLASKVIIMTSKIDAVDAVKANEVGADDFTVKTSDLKPLIATVKSLS